MLINLEKLQSEISKRHKHLFRRKRPQQRVVVTETGSYRKLVSDVGHGAAEWAVLSELDGVSS